MLSCKSFAGKPWWLIKRFIFDTRSNIICCSSIGSSERQRLHKCFLNTLIVCAVHTPISNNNLGVLREHLCTLQLTISIVMNTMARFSTIWTTKWPIFCNSMQYNTRIGLNKVSQNNTRSFAFIFDRSIYLSKKLHLLVDFRSDW